MLWQLLHLPRSATLQNRLLGDGGGFDKKYFSFARKYFVVGRVAGPDRLLRLRGLGRVLPLLRRRVEPGGVLPPDPGQGREPRHAGHQRVHRDPHPRGVRQHEDVRHGRGVRGGHQHTKQVETDTAHCCSVSGKVEYPHFKDF